MSYMAFIITLILAIQVFQVVLLIMILEHIGSKENKSFKIERKP